VDDKLVWVTFPTYLFRFSPLRRIRQRLQPDLAYDSAVGLTCCLHVSYYLTCPRARFNETCDYGLPSYRTAARR
jgi:hypothetical protein